MKKYVQARTGKRPLFAGFALGLASGVAVGVLTLFCAAGYLYTIEPPVVTLSKTVVVHPQQNDTSAREIAQVLVSKEDKPKPAVTNDSLSDWRTVRMRVTAYCPCERCCGRWADGYTANGHHIQRGDCFAAADKKYPFETELIVPGYSDGRPIQVLDRGGVIKGDRLDVFFPSHTQAAEWGVKYLDVKVRTE